MRRKIGNTVLAVLAFGLGMTANVGAQQTLPYISGFEAGEGFKLGDLQGQGGWQVDRGTASVARGGRGESQALVVEPSEPNGQVSLHLDRPEGSVVFSDFWVKPRCWGAHRRKPVCRCGRSRSGILQVRCPWLPLRVGWRRQGWGRLGGSKRTIAYRR